MKSDLQLFVLHHPRPQEENELATDAILTIGSGNVSETEAPLQIDARNPMKCGRDISRIRKTLGLLPRDIAIGAELESVEEYGHIVMGAGNTSIAKIRRIAKFLGATLQE